MSGSMRDQMPRCAAFVDALREAFGPSEITDVIKRGLRPDCKPEHRVYFSEGGEVLGRVLPEQGTVIVAAQMVIGPPPDMSNGKRGRK